MSDYSSTATSNVFINGDQAEDVLDMPKALRRDFIVCAATAGQPGGGECT